MAVVPGYKVHANVGSAREGPRISSPGRAMMSSYVAQAVVTVVRRTFSMCGQGAFVAHAHGK